MDQPLPTEVFLKVIGSTPLLDIFAFEKPTYQQMLELVQRGNSFFMDYSPHEKFFVMPADAAIALNIVSAKSSSISAMYLADKSRRNYLNDITQMDTGFFLTAGRQKNAHPIAVIVNESVVEKALEEYYARPVSTEIPEGAKFSVRREIATAHNKRVLDALLPPAPGGPGQESGPS